METAVSKWRGSDGTSEKVFHKIFIRRKPTEEHFTSWLSLWMIARSSPKKSRRRLRDALWKYSRELRGFKAGNSAAYNCVDHIANHLQRNHLANGRALSLVSKFAFTLNPLAFVPFDSRVRKALHKLGHPRLKSPYSYEIYMQCVNCELERFRISLVADPSISRQLKSSMKEFHCDSSERKLLELRTVDKALMLVGGFDPKRMREELKKLRIRLGKDRIRSLDSI